MEYKCFCKASRAVGEVLDAPLGRIRISNGKLMDPLLLEYCQHFLAQHSMSVMICPLPTYSPAKSLVAYLLNLMMQTFLAVS